MQPKYNAGTRVNVKIGDQPGYAGNPGMKRFDKATGTVVDCKTVVAFSAYTRQVEEAHPGPSLRLYMYTVEMESGVILAGLAEDSLEEHLSQ